MKRLFPRLASGAALALAAAVPAHALDFKPKLEAEGRWFFEQDDEAKTGSLAGTLETYRDWGDGKQRIVGEFFGRYDEDDIARTHLDIRELNYQVLGDDFEFRLGLRRVFWGVTESRHLVDIINQTDFVEDIDGEAKLGQPMMNLALIRDYGTVDLFVMPYQRARTFPARGGRPELPFPVQEHEAIYESRVAQNHTDYAVRYVNSFGPVDLGLAYFNGTAREPRLVPCVRRNASGQYVQGSPDGPTCDIESAIVPPPPLPPPPPDIEQQIEAEVRANLVLVPFYDLLQQVTLDGQYVIGSLALKVEGAYRVQQDEETWASVAGFEYTFGDVGGSGIDIGALAEYLYDTREDFLDRFDDEVFVGSRLALNDEAGTQLLAGALVNREDFHNRWYGVEASRRLTDDWKLSMEARLFSDIPRDDNGAFLLEQDFVTLVLERFF